MARGILFLIFLHKEFVFDHGKISSVGRALDCRARLRSQVQFLGPDRYSGP